MTLWTRLPNIHSTRRSDVTLRCTSYQGHRVTPYRVDESKFGKPVFSPLRSGLYETRGGGFKSKSPLLLLLCLICSTGCLAARQTPAGTCITYVHGATRNSATGATLWSCWRCLNSDYRSFFYWCCCVCRCSCCSDRYCWPIPRGMRHCRTCCGCCGYM